MKTPENKVTEITEESEEWKKLTDAERTRVFLKADNLTDDISFREQFKSYEFPDPESCP